MPTPDQAAASRVSRYEWLALAAAAVLMVAVLSLHLFSALIAGLLVHELVQSLSRRLRLAGSTHKTARLLALALLTTVLIALLTIGVFNFINFLRHGGDSLPALLGRVAESLDDSRGRLPAWLLEAVPTDVVELRSHIVAWLREHSATVQGFGTSFGRVLAHILVGMIVGAMIAVRAPTPDRVRGPLAQALIERASRLAASFRRVVFAQAWIATINASFTGLYLAVALPLFDVNLPQVKALIVVTWVAGLLPIVGNLMSNVVIVAVSLGYSLPLAIISLAFLITIHKLEYFLNARIVGSQISARAWELLIVMLTMESAFGIGGLVAAPIFYAYFKDELTRLRLI